MKKISTIILFLLFQNFVAQEPQPFEFNKIYSYVLQGDVAKVLKVLDTLPEERLSFDEKKIKEKYLHRFRWQDTTAQGRIDMDSKSQQNKVPQDPASVFGFFN